MKNIYTYICTLIVNLLFLILIFPYNLFAQTPISGIINTYYAVNQLNGVNYCSNSLTLTNCAGLNIGDKVFIIQMKGATIDTSNTTLSGSVTSYNGAGKYEMAIIDSINGCELIFRDSLVNTYNSAGYIQVISIPQYNDVIIADTLKCLEWNGSTGGVVIFEATGTVTMNAPINVSGNGFKGGVLFTCNANFTGTGPNYVMPSISGSSVKGEGIASLPPTLIGGRGTIANGGGAGGAQPAQAGLTDAFYNGGGGGGNYGAGGNGGKSSTAINPQYPGGLGGRALIYSTIENRIFMGGGGGSGHRRYATSGPTNGTNGAGIIIIRANTINGNNQNVFADGVDNLNILSNVGRGGGGAGGTVVLDVNNYVGTLNISVKGGVGGSNSGGSYVGPGGGGGGGIIWVKNASVPASIVYNISGGANGIHLNGGAWGSTPGENGATLTNFIIPQGQNQFIFIDSVTSASANSPLCQGETIFLQAGTVPGNASYQWIGPNNDTMTVQNPQITNATPTNSGTYNLQVLINGCPGPPVSTDVLVYPTPSVPTVQDTSICFGTTTPTLIDISNSPGLVKWYNNPSLITPIHTGTSYLPPVSAVGTYTYYITHTQNNCESPPDTAVLNIYAIPSAPTANNETVCQGNPVPNLTATATGTIKWYDNPSLITPVYTGTSFNTNQVNPGTYTYYVTQTINNCESPSATVTLTIVQTPVVNTISNIIVCPNQQISIPAFTSTPGGASFAWANSNTNIGLVTNGTGNIASWTAPANGTGTNITGTISVTPTLNGCPGTPLNFTVTVKPSPVVNAVNNVVVCPGTPINIGNFTSNPGGSTYAWSNTNTNIGLAANGTGNIPQWNAAPNATGANIMGTISVTPTLNSCSGNPMNFTVTIYPTPTVNAVSNINVCPGNNITVPNFVSVPSGASISWTNSNTAIGLGATGTGNISSWTAPANGTGSNITGNITVTPTLNGCQGVPMIFTITIYPTPSVNQILNVEACPGSTISLPNFGSVPNGASFTWSNSNTAIGLPASGTGNINPWTAPPNSTGSNITGNITVIPQLNGCSGNTPMTFSVSVLPTPSSNAISNIAVCPGQTINIPNFSSNPSGASYNWTNTNTNIGLVASGSGNIASWAAPSNTTNLNITGTITATPTLNGCIGSPVVFNVTVYPTPSANSVSNISVCPGAAISIPAFTSNPAGSSFNWANSNTAIGLVANGIGNIASWTAPPNTTNLNITGTITVTPTLNGCSGTSTSFTITVFPTPSVNSISNIAVCPGETISIPNFASTPSGSSFSWSNSNTAIGLTANGNGNIPSWAAPSNTTNLNITSTISVTPTLNGCPGTPSDFTVTIYPTPSVNSLSNINSCPGVLINVPSFVSVPSGSSFTWTNSNINIGLAANGIGNITPFNAAANTTNVNITGVITVTPTLNGCTGNAVTFDITVYPTPTVNNISNISVCPGATIDLGVFGSTPSGASFTWTNSNINIGLSGSGSGNIPSWAAPQNTTGVDITGIISVIPTLNGCEGSPMNVSITVLTSPIVNQKTDIFECSGTFIDIGDFISNPPGSSFTWTNSNTDLGIPASGTGSIPIWIAPANTTGSNITGNIVVTPSSVYSCVGTPMSFSVTIFPIPNIDQIPNISVCPGDQINIGNFISVPSNATFAWTNSNTNIGLPSNGTGNILSWIAPPNSTNNDIVGIINVIPTSNGCQGPPMLFNITIKPTPTVDQINNIEVCPGEQITIGSFNSTPSGATFNWVNSNTSIGLTSNGTGNISPWIAPANGTYSDITGGIDVIPVLDGCPGVAMSFDVTILPTPSVQQINDIVVCPDDDIIIGNFDGNPSGTSFQWTNSNTAIGLAAGGTGQIAVWTAPSNNTGSDISGTITVTPIRNGCSGVPISFDITIKPTPSVDVVNNINVCPGDLINIPDFSSTPQGATFTWTNSNTNIGLASSGTGNISPWNAPTNTSGTDIVTTVSVAPTLNGCPGPVMNFTITDFTSPVVNQITDIEVCSGDIIDIGNFVSNPVGSTFNWVNSNTDIGIAGSGSGSIPSWTAPDNYTGSNITGTITVTPSSTFSCIGTPMNFDVTIFPIPVLDPISDIDVCPGVMINVDVFNSNPTGASFDWTNTNTAIGILATGSGQIVPWAAPSNTTGTNITGIISVVPILNGCQGPNVDFTVLIYPTPSAPLANDEQSCFGFTVPDLFATGTGLIQWYDNSSVNPPPIYIGSTFTTGNTVVGAYTYYVTQTENNCESLPTEVMLTIFPIPIAPSANNVEVCFGSAVPDLVATGTGTIDWFDDPSLSPLLFTGATYPTGQINVGHYTYYVIQSENDCQSPATTVTLDIFPVPTAPVSQNEEECEGYPIPFLTATGTGLIQWYNDPSLNTVIFSGSVYDTQHTQPGTYTYYVTQTENNCESLPSTVTLTIHPTPQPPTANNVAVCYGFSVPDLTASGTGTMQWYDDISLTTPIFTGNNFPTGETAVGTYVYYVTQTVNNCESPAITVSLTIHPIPTAPFSNDVEVCYGQTVPDLSASGTGTIQWYDNPGLISPVQTGSTYNTTQINVGIYTYYVTQSENNCESPATTVVLTIYPIPAVPQVTNVEVCYGQTVPDLEVIGTGNIQWYDNPTGTPPAIQTGATFTTGHTAVDTYTYFVTQIENNCESPVIPVSLTIHPIPLAPFADDVVACFGDTNITHFIATATGTVKWYDDASLTPPELHIGTSYNSGESNVGVYDYYLTQTVNNCESQPYSVTLTINPVPPPPSSSNVSSCFGQTVPDLIATGTGIIQWYTDSSLTYPPISVGATYTTGLQLSGTYTFFVTQFENGCESEATSVTLSIIALPQPPQSSNASICFGQPTPNLTATASGTIKWYGDANLTQLLFTGSSFATGETAVGTYTYYVTQTHLTTTCQSNPTTVTLSIHPIPVAPTVSDFESCTGLPTPDFTAVATGTINWYANSSLNPVIYTGNNFASGHTSAGSYTYYVTQTENNCEGPSSEITLTIYQTPAAPQISDENSCFGSTVPDLTASGTGVINWYSDINLINLVNTGATYTTPHTNIGTYTYYVTQTENNCVSPYSTINLTIHPIPVVPVVSNLEACFGSQIPSFTATATGTVQWYDNPLLSPVIYTGSTFATGETAVGTYTYYVTQIENNCESISDTVTLIIHPIPAAPQASDVNVCYGLNVPDLTATGTGVLNWYNNSSLIPPVVNTGGSFATPHTAVGIYTYYVAQTENNCEGPATTVNLNIISLPLPPSSSNVEVCFGFPTPDLIATGLGTINWYDNGALTTPIHTGSPFATGQTNVNTYTYYVTQTDVSTSCQSLADTISLTIHPIPVAPALSDTSSCFGSPTPNLIATGAGTIQWYNNLSLNPVLFTGSSFATNQNAVGTYTYYATQTVNNCESPAATVILTIYPIPAAPVVSVNSPVCEGENIIFSADTVANATYSWTGPLSFTSASQNPVISQTTVGNGGQYGLVVIVNGCPSPVTNTNVVIIPSLTPSISGNAPFCEGHSTDLDAGVFTTYLWSTGDSTQIITITLAGTYSVTVSDVNGCTASDEVIATFSIPPPAYAGVDTSMCLNNTIQLTASGGVTYDWSPSAGLSNSGIFNPIASPTVTTTYILTVLDGAGCVGKDTIVITVHPLPNVNFASNVETGCEPLMVQFTDLSSSNIATWLWQFGDPLSGIENTSTQQNPTHIYNTTGDYSVTLSVTTIHGCTGQVSYANFITVYPVPTADFDFYPDYADFENSIITFINQSTNDNAWYWDFGDNTTSVIPNPIHEYIDPGTYEVTLVVQSTLGCTDTIMKEIIYKPFYTIYAPTAFSPNDDGRNDYFIPKGVGLNNDEFNMYIYNRWGELVYETNDYNKGWDGKTFEGNPAPEAVYTWIIFMRTLDGTDFVYRHTGHVLLLRY